MLARSRFSGVSSAEPIALKASFEGAKMVTSVREFIPSTNPAAVNAPAREVKPVLMAVWPGVAGTVRTVSIMWRVLPPSSSMSFQYVSSVLFPIQAH